MFTSESVTETHSEVPIPLKTKPAGISASGTGITYCRVSKTKTNIAKKQATENPAIKDVIDKCRIILDNSSKKQMHSTARTG